MDKGRNQIKALTLRHLTTFTPTLNQNMFHLSQDKLSALDPQSTQGTLIVLSAEETLCIGGACLLTVLRGTVSLLGTTLTASTRRHRIYAPNASPLPVLEAISPEPSNLSDDQSQQLGIFGISGAVILIQELQTGVQGLGHVCKVFSGTFDYASQGEDTKMLNITGTYIVNLSTSFSRTSI
jgi:polynucleotide 5'-hydroxyl-kinase GRC3/NOL9